jgi:XTP/dITP diphosphohydrolase
MNGRKQLLIGTSNPGKADELRALLADAPIELVTPADLGLQLSVTETGDTYRANAERKARAYARAAGRWALADDTGLEVDALDGAPGLYSARLAGPDASDADRRFRLLALLAPHPRPWLARFHCTLAVATPDRLIAITEGECPGQIIPQARGDGGFGYDPVFLIDGEGMTMAELSAAHKNRISHRARAAAAMVPLLRQQLSGR